MERPCPHKAHINNQYQGTCHACHAWSRSKCWQVAVRRNEENCQPRLMASSQVQCISGLETGTTFHMVGAVLSDIRLGVCIVDHLFEAALLDLLAALKTTGVHRSVLVVQPRRSILCPRFGKASPRCLIGNASITST